VRVSIAYFRSTYANTKPKVQCENEVQLTVEWQLFGVEGGNPLLVSAMQSEGKEFLSLTRLQYVRRISLAIVAHLSNREMLLRVTRLLDFVHRPKL
jgi:hypothetical protein